LDGALRDNIAEIDLNNLPDTDTLHCPSGPIREAEEPSSIIHRSRAHVSAG
jgi:hypothetical protein